MCLKSWLLLLNLLLGLFTSGCDEKEVVLVEEEVEVEEEGEG